MFYTIKTVILLTHGTFIVAADKNELFCILNSGLEREHGVQLHPSFVIVKLMFIIALAIVS